MMLRKRTTSKKTKVQPHQLTQLNIGKKTPKPIKSNKSQQSQHQSQYQSQQQSQQFQPQSLHHQSYQVSQQEKQFYQHNSARVVKLEKIVNTFHNHHPSAFQSMTTIGCHDKFIQKINLNDEIINRRKENHLNTQYNRRLNALKQITKDNKKIYERINSQKSLYSQDQMRKSSVSIRSLSRSSSRVSNQSRNSKNHESIKKPPRPKASLLTIQPESIGALKSENVNQFKSIFLVPSKDTIKSKPQDKREQRSFSLKQDPTKKSLMGNMLHKIAEEMTFVGPDRRPPKSRNCRIMY